MDEHAHTGVRPFEILHPAGEALPVVFSSPHSGTIYPEDIKIASGISPHLLHRSEDLLVDTLLTGAPELGFTLIRAMIARAYVDVNRAADEIDERMIQSGHGLDVRLTPRVEAGLGVIFRIAADGRRLYDRQLSGEEVRARLDRVHRPWHEAVPALLDDAVSRKGAGLLIDWHSMPSHALSDPGSIDVVLGDRFGTTCSPVIMDAFEAMLRGSGLRVLRNTPYAGGYGVERHGQPSLRRHALQVEINRALYLDEARLEPTTGLAGLRDILEQVFREMARSDWGRLLHCA